MAALAERCVPETSPSTINKLEKDEITIDPEWARKLAAALDVDPLDFLAPLADLSEQESTLVQLFRGLSDADRQAVYHVANAMAQPAPAKRRDGTGG